MRPKRIDKNQPEIVAGIRKIPGATVRHTHVIGDGFVDVVMGYKGVNYLLEIKDPSKPPSGRKLTPDEERFHNTWTGQKAIIETIEDVLKLIQ